MQRQRPDCFLDISPSCLYYVDQTKKSYNATAAIYASRYAGKPSHLYFQNFLHKIPINGRILDIGCGHGRFAYVFSESNRQVTGIDFSEQMIQIARKLAPKAEFFVMDMLDLQFPAESFDGVLASASLLHIPKQCIPSLLNRVHSFIKKGGWLHIFVKEGNGEVFEEDIRYGDVKKFWAYYQQDEIKNLIEASRFNIELINIIQQSSTTSHPFHNFIEILAQKV